MTAAGALTEHDVVAVREEVAAGRPVTVWFTAAAVGVSAGGSATVVAVGDPAEGECVQVRRTGSRDAIFCSPNELTRTRPTRRRSTPGGAAPAATDPAPTGPAATGPAPTSTRSTRHPAAAAPVGSARTPASRRVGTASPPVGSAGTAPAALTSLPVDAPDVPPVRVGVARRRATGPAGTTLRLTATAEGEWSVEVLVGTKQVVPSMPVPASGVAIAARSLPPAVAEAIGSALEDARRLHRDRVEQLRGELDAAQRLLDQLDI